MQKTSFIRHSIRASFSSRVTFRRTAQVHQFVTNDGHPSTLYCCSSITFPLLLISSRRTSNYTKLPDIIYSLFAARSVPCPVGNCSPSYCSDQMNLFSHSTLCTHIQAHAYTFSLPFFPQSQSFVLYSCCAHRNERAKKTKRERKRY